MSSLLLALLSPVALGSGYFFSDSGIVAAGRGGAWVAGADTQFAQFVNPAGLVRVEAPTLNLGWSGVAQKVRFQRVDVAGDAIYPAVENQAPPFAVPQLGFVTPVSIGGQQLAFAFGFMSPFAPSFDYPKDGPQRYSVVDTAIYQFGVGPSLAWRPSEKFAIGVGMQWSVLTLGEQLAITMSGQDDPGGDVFVDARTKDLFTPTFNVGLIVEPVAWMSLGASLMPGARFDTRGSLEVDFSGNNLEPFVDPPGSCADPTDLEACPRVFRDDDVGLELRLPTVVRTGVAVWPIPELELELDWVWQNQAALSEILVKDIDITIVALGAENPVDRELNLPAGFKNASSIRLGGEYDKGPWALRLGGFYEQSALEPQQVSVALVDTDKWQIGSGGTARFLDRRLSIDVAAALIFLQSLQVRDSTVSQVNAGVLNDDTTVVGNGDYDSSGWVMGAQARWAFRAKGG